MTEDGLTIEQRAIYEVISAYSEERWCAGWMSGVEHQIWHAQHTDPLILAVHALAEKFGYWITWQDGPVAVPLAEWAAQNPRKDQHYDHH